MWTFAVVAQHQNGLNWPKLPQSAPNKKWLGYWQEGWVWHTCGWYKDTYVYMQLCKGDGTEIGNQVNMHTCTDACTHSNQGVEPKEGWIRTWMWGYMFPDHHARECEQRWGVRWTLYVFWYLHFIIGNSFYWRGGFIYCWLHQIITCLPGLM